MDLLFKRYASPYLLVDELLKVGQFADFTKEIDVLYDDDKMWSYWMHNVRGQTFAEWKQSLSGQATVTTDNFETTINDSFDIIQGFIPDEK